jgi:hypothetical protein
MLGKSGLILLQGDLSKAKSNSYLLGCPNQNQWPVLLATSCYLINLIISNPILTCIFVAKWPHWLVNVEPSIGELHVVVLQSRVPNPRSIDSPSPARGPARTLDSVYENMENLGPSWLPSGYVKIAIEHGPVEIVVLPIDRMVIFHSYVNVYQRVIIGMTPKCDGAPWNIGELYIDYMVDILHVSSTNDRDYSHFLQPQRNGRRKPTWNQQHPWRPCSTPFLGSSMCPSQDCTWIEANGNIYETPLEYYDKKHMIHMMTNCE